MKYPDVHEHPYLHLFPELKYMASQIERDFPYIPFMDMDRGDRRYSIMDETFSERYNHFDLAATHNGLTYFIYNPWFEQVQYEDSARRVPHLPRTSIDIGRQDGEPYWFGNNSTRGVLAETVAKLLEEAKLPSAEAYPRDWWTQQEPYGEKYIRPESFAPQEWTLDEYIRTGVQYGGPEDDRFEYEQVEFHNIPQVTWEFLDPKLPILRVTAHAEQRLPLVDPTPPKMPKPFDKIPNERAFLAVITSNYYRDVYWGLTMEEVEAKYLEWLNKRTKATALREHETRTNAITRYSVSFVMSLQNRWTSFDDPDRWIVRFGEDLELYFAPPHHVDRGQGKGAQLHS